MQCSAWLQTDQTCSGGVAFWGMQRALALQDCLCCLLRQLCPVGSWRFPYKCLARIVLAHTVTGGRPDHIGYAGQRRWRHHGGARPCCRQGGFRGFRTRASGDGLFSVECGSTAQIQAIDLRSMASQWIPGESGTFEEVMFMRTALPHISGQLTDMTSSSTRCGRIIGMDCHLPEVEAYALGHAGVCAHTTALALPAGEAHARSLPELVASALNSHLRYRHGWHRAHDWLLTIPLRWLAPSHHCWQSERILRCQPCWIHDHTPVLARERRLDNGGACQTMGPAPAFICNNGVPLRHTLAEPEMTAKLTQLDLEYIRIGAAHLHADIFVFGNWGGLGRHVFLFNVAFVRVHGEVWACAFASTRSVSTASLRDLLFVALEAMPEMAISLAHFSSCIVARLVVLVQLAGQ